MHRDTLHRDTLHRDTLHRDTLHRDTEISALISVSCQFYLLEEFEIFKIFILLDSTTPQAASFFNYRE